MCELSDGFGKAEYVGLESLCKTYGLEFVCSSFNQRSDIILESKWFFENCLGQIDKMTVTPIKLLFTVGMILGNPFFNHIPTIFETTNESVDREELV